MTDDDGEVDGAAPFPRSYDFFKHMTGIVLISVGGVFAFIDGTGPRLDRRSVTIVLVALMLSGAISLVMATTLAELEIKPVKRAKLVVQIRRAQIAASFFLAVGLGVFVPAFVEAARLAG